MALGEERPIDDLKIEPALFQYLLGLRSYARIVPLVACKKEQHQSRGFYSFKHRNQPVIVQIPAIERIPMPGRRMGDNRMDCNLLRGGKRGPASSGLPSEDDIVISSFAKGSDGGNEVLSGIVVSITGNWPYQLVNVPASKAQ